MLLVEDDVQIAKVLKMNLELGGYSIDLATTASNSKGLVAASPSYELLLLDINLPDGNGLDLLHELRGIGCSAPAIFLSARTDEETVVKAMNIGAEDYLRKPFGTEELKARIQRVARRTIRSEISGIGGLTVNNSERIAKFESERLNISRKEFDILFYLVKSAPSVVSRDQIMNYIDSDSEIYDRTIDSHISRIRRRLKECTKGQIVIESVYGVGYRISAEEQ
ncbi:MAG: response regulator transcription factor [Pseudomonadota bacterium]